MAISASMRDSEKLVEHTLVMQIKAAGGMCIKLLSYQFIGLPDRLCLLPGHKIAFVELKTTGMKPRKIQHVVHNSIRELGFRVEVIDSVSGVYEFIKSFKNEV